MGSTVPACIVVRGAELLLPSTRPLYRACLDHMARTFQVIAAPSQPPPQQPQQAQQAHSQQGPVPMDACPCGPADTLLTNPAAAAAAVRPVGAEHLTTPITLYPPPPPPPTNTAGPPTNACRPPPTDFECLPLQLLCELLSQNSITVPEQAIFDAVVRWAQAGRLTDVGAVGGDGGGPAASQPAGSSQTCGSSVGHRRRTSFIDDGWEELLYRSYDDVDKVLCMIRYPLMTPQVCVRARVCVRVCVRVRGRGLGGWATC